MAGIRRMDRNLALEVVRVTEAAALAAFRWMGRGDEEAADKAAADAMREALNSLEIDGEVVIGAGERGEVDALFVGDRVGSGSGPAVDIALESLEGTTITAMGGPNALSVVAMAPKGGFLKVPDIYMEKIAVGGGLPDDLIDLDAPPQEALRAIAEAKAMDIEDLVVCILDRPRHEGLIAAVREVGSRIVLIPDGDVSGVIATARPESGIDAYMGVGGAQEGVLAAAALRCVGGQMMARLVARSGDERGRAREHGITDVDRIYRADELASGEVMFAATGVTPGTMLRGVRRIRGGAVTHSIVMRSKTSTVRLMESHHQLDSRGAIV
jgi:fructose-1,6-bisphosphatase II / sedoheptulose-1,7-bisphosphatase